MTFAQQLRGRLSLPVVAAPMFLISGADLVIACCKAGIIGSFPTLNARTPEALDDWLDNISNEIQTYTSAHPGAKVAPHAANIVVHPSNPRWDEDIALIAKHKVPIVIASIGDPIRAVEPVRRYGGAVLADVASIRHARKAVERGVDGLILLCAGAGGNTGSLNPFAFVREVRQFYDGPLLVAGGMSDGRAIRAMEVIGADLAYMGTRFISTKESMANPRYQQMLVDSGADDIVLTAAVTGIPANFLRPSLDHAGFDLGKQRHNDKFDVQKEIDTANAWRDVWSAGHGVGGTKQISDVAGVVTELRSEYEALAGK